MVSVDVCGCGCGYVKVGVDDDVCVMWVCGVVCDVWCGGVWECV